MVIKFGYDVMYKAYDGLYMRPVMTYTVRVMSSTESVWWHIEWMRWQIKRVSSQIQSLGSHTHIMGDNIYIAYDVINRVCAMTYKQWCLVSKCGCDVILSAYGVIHAVGVISYVHRVWYHQSSVFFFRLYRIYWFFVQNTV